VGERAQLMFASGRFIKGMDLPTSETVPSRYWTSYFLNSVAVPDSDPDPYRMFLGLLDPDQNPLV
jgi:hypothetical protein